MNREAFRRLTEGGVVLLDGAMGSNLRAAGMPVGVCTEEWSLAHPDVIADLQARYADAGSRIVYAPTFGANEVSLEMYGLGGRMAEINRNLTAITRSAVGERAYIAGDITTLGKPIDGNGDDYARLFEVYARQARALIDAGVDLFAVETMLGVNECCAAIEAIRSLCDYPIICTLTLDGVGKAYYDGDAESAAQQLTAIGADAVGVNCGNGPELFESVIASMARNTDLPIVAKPNAGMPTVMPDGSCVYGMSPTRFARAMARLIRAGARIVGGCCGTTPDHIRALKEII